MPKAAVCRRNRTDRRSNGERNTDLTKQVRLVLRRKAASISVTLFAILASSAPGSHLAGRVRMPAARLVRIAVGAAVALVVAYGSVLQPIEPRAHDAPTRSAAPRFSESSIGRSVGGEVAPRFGPIRTTWR